MRLAKLTVSGFKSFADRTEFSFDHPITGVVGPNGCGKSNIVDAIKWVLGERSSKSLRGTEMLDVIFAGSAGRKPGGMASVSLTFENPVVERPVDDLAQPVSIVVPGGDAEAVASTASVTESVATASADEAAPASPSNDSSATGEESVVDASVRRRRLLPIDADVVEVERRLYRDGESAYLINGRKARLKDIRELFLDTGVGADAYSIIEQGKVDAMLLASPQERRVIFEEAAGIAKYKQRRIEAQRKLDRAQDNLTTAREELDSTERRLRLVRGQAAKARKFKELDAEFKAWRLALAFDQYDELEQRIVSIASRHNELGGVREAAGAKLAELEAGRQGAELARQEATSSHRGLEQERLSAVHAEQQATQRRTMLERAIGESTRQAALDRDRFVAVEQRRQETERSIEQYEKSTAEMAAQVAGAEGRLA
ncbi:MAG: Chromosome partition protein Smc, partial [Planctomycetota bacterium]